MSPGAEEAAMLEAMCRHIVDHAQSGYDIVVFDTAPTGHTLRLLELPQMMRMWTDGLLAQQAAQNRFREAAQPFWQNEKDPALAAANPLSETRNRRWQEALDVLQRRRELFAEAAEILGDAGRCGIVLVMLPEMLPLEETRRAIAQLAHFRLPCSDVIINQVIAAPQSDPFWQQRLERQQEIVAVIEQDFAALNRHYFGLQATDVRGLQALRRFGNDGRISD